MDAGSAWDGSGYVDGSPDMVFGSADIALLDRLELELEDAARALRRLDEATYATCEVCGQPIGDDRLATSPVTRRCAEHDRAGAPGPTAEG